jgi:hypothetical protein
VPAGGDPGSASPSLRTRRDADRGSATKTPAMAKPGSSRSLPTRAHYLDAGHLAHRRSVSAARAARSIVRERVEPGVEGVRADAVEHPGEVGAVHAAHELGRIAGQGVERAVRQRDAVRVPSGLVAVGGEGVEDRGLHLLWGRCAGSLRGTTRARPTPSRRSAVAGLEEAVVDEPVEVELGRVPGDADAGGSLVYDYGFNVETAGDHPVWHRSETDVFPGQRD